MTLKKKWFDMIKSGEKKEEYREIKPYWGRLGKNKYDCVIFKNGYRKDSPKICLEIIAISTGFAKPEWSSGDNKERVYIITLGDIVN